MLFRIYTSHAIGSEGMGLYQLILSVYALGATFATCGISTAVTRLTTDALALGRPRAVRRILSRSMLLSSAIGLVSGGIIFFGADFIGAILLKDIRTVAALRVLCLSLPFMGITACLRGYFLARRRASDTAGAQIFEQAVRMGLIWLGLSRAEPGNLALACGIVMAGDTAAETASCLLLWLRYRQDSRCLAGTGSGSLPVLRPLLRIAVPITAGRYLSTALRTAENILVPTRLAAHFDSRDRAVSSFGSLKGMAMPLLFFPSSFLSSLSLLLIPEVSEAHALGNTARVQRAVCRTLRLTLLSSLLISGIFTVYAPELGQLIYRSDEVGQYLRVLGPLMPIMYAESVVDGILKGLGQQVSSLKYSVLDSATRILMILGLVSRFGMPGFLFVMLVSNLLTCFLNIHRLLTVTQVRFRWKDWVLLPGLAALAAGSAVVALQQQLGLAALPALAAGSVLFAAMYLLLLWLFGCLRREDLPFTVPVLRKAPDKTPLLPEDCLVRSPHDAPASDDFLP